jgi:ribosome biogenesis protein MAK21
MPPTAASSSKTKLLVPPTSDWYNFIPPLRPTTEPVLSQSSSHIATLLNRASSLHVSELANFSALPNPSGGPASDQSFLRNVLTGGTLSDRLSALTLMAQGAPLHNIRALEALKSLAEKGRGGVNVSQDGEKSKGKAAGREERLKAARAIMDWWVGGGAPNRKLKCVSFHYTRIHIERCFGDLGISATSHCCTPTWQISTSSSGTSRTG